MTKKKKIGLGICIAIVLSSIIFSGCVEQETPKTAIPQVLTIAHATDTKADKIDAGTYLGSIMVHPMIYDSLVKYGDEGKILPGLATSWDISEDSEGHMIITFNLRKGVKFSDGTPFNAAAIKFSLERTKILQATDKTPVISYLDDIEVVDEYTVKLHYSTYSYPILKQLTFPRPIRIMSPTAVNPKGDPNGTFIKPIGTGPWMLESYVEDQYTTLIRNPYYWGEKPILEKITFKIIPDPQTRALAVQGGDVDMAGGAYPGRISPEMLPVLEKDPKIKIERKSSTQAHYLIFRYDREPFNDTRIRKAINYAIDKESITRVIGVGKPAKGLFPPTVDYITPDNSYGYPYDLEKAKQLLAEAGWSDTDKDGLVDKGGKPLEMNLIYQTTEFPEWRKMCQLIQEDLRKVGINVKLLEMESAAYYDKLWKSREFDLLLYRTYEAQWCPDGFLTSHFLYPSKVGDMAVTYGNPELNQLINSVLATHNENERTTIYNHIFKLMYDEAACAPLYYPEQIFVMNSRIQDFGFGSSEYEPVKWEKLLVS